MRYHSCVTKSAKALAKLRESPTNVRYADPRVNIQRAGDGGVKIYQLKQVVAAIDKLQQMEPEEGA
jgi:hypothetical protein